LDDYLRGIQKQRPKKARKKEKTNGRK